jgi:hypothetical protein
MIERTTHFGAVDIRAGRLDRDPNEEAPVGGKPGLLRVSII